MEKKKKRRKKEKKKKGKSKREKRGRTCKRLDLYLIRVQIWVVPIISHHIPASPNGPTEARQIRTDRGTEEILIHRAALSYIYIILCTSKRATHTVASMS